MNKRELKFRAWNNEQKKFEYFELHNITVPDRLLTQDKFPVQQWTGLYDKNKKPIYEGDIISYLQHLFNASPDNYPVKTKEVKWKNMKGCWNVYESQAGEDNLEVIGNIFENEK